MILSHRDGRVTKAEGNPNHPLNQGGLCARGQSSLQGLYDPDRLKKIVSRIRSDTDITFSWDKALAFIASRLKRTEGALTLISDLQTGSLPEIMRSFVSSYSDSELLFWEPFDYRDVISAHKDLFGKGVVPKYELDKSDLIVSFSCDFLETWLSPVEFAHQFSKFHAYNNGKVNPFFYVGPRLSMTAANADSFMKVAPGTDRLIAAGMLKIMMDRGWAKNSIEKFRVKIEGFLDKYEGRMPISKEKLLDLSRRFAQAKSPVAMAGTMGATGVASRESAMLAALLNYAAGSMGKSVDLSRPHAVSGLSSQENVLARLSRTTDKDIVIIHNANPVYALPESRKYLKKAGLIIYIGVMQDETARMSHINLPLDYYLESFGDYSPYPGINGLCQPVMRRLYETRPLGDILIDLAARTGRPISFPGAKARPSNLKRWLDMKLDKASKDGRLSAFYKKGTYSAGFKRERFKQVPSPYSFKLSPVVNETTLKKPQLWLWPSSLLFDGRFANRTWLQEAPHPTSHAAWGSWADIHPSHAKKLGIKNGDFINLGQDPKAKVTVRVTEDVYPGVVSMGFGQGHTSMGSQAEGVGINAFELISKKGDSIFSSIHPSRTSQGKRPVYMSASTDQKHREIIQTIKLSALSQMSYRDGHKLKLPLAEGYDPKKDIYPRREYKKHRWAMAIDLQKCIGCGSCAVACYAENNIPSVGRQHARDGLEMAWLKVVPYRDGNDKAKMHWLPLLCQHCDSAPCEPVCPVFASVHNEEGLNAQIYNRCIGTRYCSNNCPYKVRRFNWKKTKWRKPLDLQLNPEVSVRGKGVMEKCTFCIQRIKQADYRARKKNRPIRDGEIKPACMQSCPTGAIVFGNLKDPNSRISIIARKDPRRYQLLHELNTKPAVIFLKKIINDKGIA